MFRIDDSEIGGAVVRRTFNNGGKRMIAGMRLSAEEVLSFRRANRNSLAEKAYIDIFPRGGAMQEKGERFVINAGFGRFFVIEGKKLNADALDREQAYALAGTEPPPKQQRRAAKDH